MSNDDHSGRMDRGYVITLTLVHTVLAAAIGSGFQHGYNAGVINAPQMVITSWMNETLQTTDQKLELVWSSIISVFCIGGMIGGSLTSVVATRFGRRKALIGNNFLATAAGLINGTSRYINSPVALGIGRLIAGVNAGFNAGVAPMYLSEISPQKIRGAIGSMYQLVITVSILLAQLIGMERVLGSKELWPLLMYLPILVAIYQIIALLLSPESPKFLLEKNKDEEAAHACEKLCGPGRGSANMTLIKNEIAEDSNRPKVTLKDMWMTPKYKKPLIIMCLLMAAQQMSGINAVIYSSTEIFNSATLDYASAQVATVGVGVVNVFTTVVSIFLVEMVGRKPLLAFGFGGISTVLILFMIALIFSSTIKAMAYVAIALLYGYIVMFAIGAGSIPWILGSELFATAARPLGLSIAVPVNWLFNFIVVFSFLPLKTIMGNYVFLIYIVSSIAAMLYFTAYVPETKNRPIEEITESFR